jgi:hypothetical protein|tara:strand:+ start:166 stop:324 length:159 start_codon:yes stop_codon:yes gene_type:complete
MKKIIFVIFLTACSSENLNNNVLNFDKDLTFDEFKILLEEYNKINGYPEIDK